MKKKHYLLSGLSGLALALLFTGSAHAVTASVTDLILGFRASGGQGGGANLEVNLGSAATYAALAPNTSFVVTNLSALDLVSTYGANWDARNDLAFGIVGATGASIVGGIPARTIWASNGQTISGTTSTPWVRGSASGQQNSAGAITTMYSGPAGSLTLGSATPNSAFSSVIDNTLGGSWTVQDDITVGQSFRRFTPTVTTALGSIPTLPSIYDGTSGYKVLDVWELRPGTGDGALLGSFGLNSSGQLVFSNSPGVFAAIPEPATTAALAGAACALLMRRRRPVTA